MNIQIGDYEVDSVILDLGSDVNIPINQTWEKMGKPQLFWSPVQLRLSNQAKFQPIGRVSNLVVDIKCMNTYDDFSVIEVVDCGGSYPGLLGIGRDNDSMEIINFKKRVMTFENQHIRVIAPMEPQEGRQYIEPITDEVGRGLDHAYNISKDYIHPTIDGKFRWRSYSSASSDSDDAL